MPDMRHVSTVQYAQDILFQQFETPKLTIELWPSYVGHISSDLSDCGMPGMAFAAFLNEIAVYQGQARSGACDIIQTTCRLLHFQSLVGWSADIFLQQPDWTPVSSA